MSACGAGGLGCQQDTPGAEIIQSMRFLENNNQLPRGDYTSYIVSNIVAYGFFSAFLECKENYNIDQELKVECNGSPPVIDNPNCDLCIQTVQKIVEDRKQLDATAHSKNGNYQVPIMDEDLQNKLFGDPKASKPGSAGICRYMCFQCIAENIEQNMNVKIEETCDFNNEQFRKAFKQGVTTASVQEMYKHQNELSKTGLKTKSVDNIKQLGIHLSNTIVSMTSEQIMASLKSDVFALQNISFDPNSTSVVLTNFQQNMTISSYAKMIQNTYSNDNIDAATKSDILEKEIELRTTFSDLFKDLEATIDSFSDLAKSIAGRFAMTVVVLLLVALLVFAAVFYFKPKFLFYGVSSAGSSLTTLT